VGAVQQRGSTDVLIVSTAKDDDRAPRCDGYQIGEGLDAGTVWQGEIEKDRLRVLAGEAVEGVGEGPDPFDTRRIACRCGHGRVERRGVPRIVIDEKSVAVGAGAHGGTSCASERNGERGTCSVEHRDARLLSCLVQRRVCAARYPQPTSPTLSVP